MLKVLFLTWLVLQLLLIVRKGFDTKDRAVVVIALLGVVIAVLVVMGVVALPAAI